MENSTLTGESLRVFMAYAEDAGNWGGMPLVGGNVGGTREERGNLTDLKRKGLITTHVEKNGGGDGSDIVWITFTDEGRKFAEDSGVSTANWY